MRWSVWLAIACFPAGALGQALARWGSPEGTRLARWVWTLGAVAFMVHVAAAFHLVYGWSHSAALQETARQTAELTGWRSGAGLYLNYLFLALWLFEVGWWWVRPAGYARRPPAVALGAQAFQVFMVLNGAVVFGHGPVRWLGSIATLCTLAIVVSLRSSRTTTERTG